MASQPRSLHAGADFDAAAAVLQYDLPGVSTPGGTGRVYHKPPRQIQAKAKANSACMTCRSRKVRCSIVISKPCMNCRMAGIPCVVPKKRPRKKSNPTTGRLFSGTIQGSGSSVSPNFQPNDDAAVRDRIPMCATTPTIPRSVNWSCTTIVAENPTKVLNINSALRGCSSQSNIWDLDGYEYPSDGSLPTPSPSELHFESKLRDYFVESATNCTSSGSTSSMKSPITITSDSLPPYLKPPPGDMSADTMHFIRERGAFTVPETTLRNQLLQCYVDYVYPFMPSIDLRSFLRIVIGEDKGAEKVSLLLFHAIMFTGTAFVDMGLLERAGYKTRIEARTAFYNKVRILYDSDYETDSVTLVQSLLLMTYWYESTDPKGPWHWMGIAISLAHTAGIHRNPKTSQRDMQRQRLWRRIWWSCYMRDQIVTLGSGRPTRIRLDDYDIPMLTLNDFDIGSFPTDCLEILHDCAFARNQALQTDLAFMCIEKVKLCMCISQVLAGHNNLLRRQKEGEGYQDDIKAKILLFPERMEQIDTIQLCEVKLKDWADALPVRFAYANLGQNGNQPLPPSFVVHRAVLHLVYFATISSLHRLVVQPSAGEPTLQKYFYYRNLLHVSYNMTRTVSFEISKICLDMRCLKLDILLPSYSLVALLPAIMVHLLDLDSSRGVVPQKALKGFLHCAHVLKQLQSCYSAAGYAGLFLRAAINRSGVAIQSNICLEHEGNVNPVGVRRSVHGIGHRPSNDRETGGALPADESFPVSIPPRNYDFMSSAEDVGTEEAAAEKVGVWARNWETLDNILDLDEPRFLHNLESPKGADGLSASKSHKSSEDTLEGLMNGECGSLFIEMEWL